MPNSPIQVGIVGGSGYSGGELLRLLIGHPGARIAWVTSRGDKNLEAVHRNLLGRGLRFIREEEAGPCDVVILCTPSRESMTKAPTYLQRGAKVIDVGSDFRLKDREQFERVYKAQHSCWELVGEAPYGATERHREAIRKARLVANPGCFAYTAILSLAPLAKAIEGLSIGRVFSSPLARCQQSLVALGDQIQLPKPCLDARLEEIDYGHCEGLTASEARQRFPRLAGGWDRGEDVRFPDGECTADVARRLDAFIDGQWDHDGPDTLTCTHNVVLRCLVGIQRPTSGEVTIGGHDIVRSPVEAKRQLAFMADEPHLFEYLTVIEHLRLTARISRRRFRSGRTSK